MKLAGANVKKVACIVVVSAWRAFVMIPVIMDIPLAGSFPEQPHVSDT